MAVNYRTAVLNSNGTPSGTTVDFEDIYVLRDQFLTAGLWACGADNTGQLGNSGSGNYSSPVQVGALTNWKLVSSGDGFSAAIKTDGTLWTWGENDKGQLGNGTTINYVSPVQLGLYTNWKQVSCGNKFTSMIKTDGTMWVCGYNYRGQLGNGTSGSTISYSSPIQVGALTNWKTLSSGFNNLFSIKTDGTLWACGYNGQGQFGNGTFNINYSSPIQIGSLTNWKLISNGSYHTSGIKTDGTLWTWGYNGYGQLGNGTAGVWYSSPIQVGLLTNWKQVACGDYHICAIKTDGTFWTWGRNDYGQFGNGTAGVSYSSPIQIGSLTNWKQVACSSYPNMIAVKTDGTLWSCGYNNQGQLGNGTNVKYSSPVQIGSLTTWKQVDMGSIFFTAIQAPDWNQ